MLRRPGTLVFMALLCCVMLAMTLTLWLVARSSDPLGDTLLVSSVTLAISWPTLRFARARVEIHGGGLHIVDVVRRTRIPWGAYRMVETDGGLTVVSRGEERHAAVAFSGSLMEDILARRGRSRTVTAAARIRAASREASAASLRDTEVTVERWEFIPADLLLAQLPVCLVLTLAGIVPR
ncbi:hypothetical protein ACIBJC_16080 [Streptomyces sp. NPDC050509]|uniref:hypothetical protein n=1 Tax=Streptomyces sp. NPDC050509 TaxID=3365620 RepID=UPI0037B1594F